MGIGMRTAVVIHSKVPLPDEKLDAIAKIIGCTTHKTGKPVMSGRVGSYRYDFPFLTLYE